LQQILFNLDDDQKITRRNLSLDIDNIIGIGSFGDVIQGKYNGQNENVSCQIHVISGKYLVYYQLNLVTTCLINKSAMLKSCPE
jgi:hypothetical protein